MKAIITDLDRTLLTTEKKISPCTLNVLKKCREKGILLMAASARPVRNILPFHDLISFDAFTASNGAVIMLPDRKMERGIDLASGEEILARLMQFPDVFLSVETSKGLYSNRDIPIWQPTVYDCFPTLPEGVVLYKILASSENRRLYQGVESVLNDEVYHTIAGENLIQIMSRKATKWLGVQHMLDYFGVSPDEAAYFGDDNDDVAPLARCGMGVAVENAIPAALQAAKYVTDSNDRDGVARFIEKHIL